MNSTIRTQPRVCQATGSHVSHELSRERNSRQSCRTCKLRRIRCDGRQPTCRRCEVARRDCVAFNPPRAASVSGEFRFLNPGENGHAKLSTSMITLPITVVTLSQSDRSALDYFSSVVIPSLTRSGLEALWSGAVLLHIYTSPVLLKVAVAVAHQSRCSNIGQPKQISEDGMDDKYRSLKSYSHALEGIQGAIESKTINSTDAALACLLLILHSILGRNYEHFSVHLNSALDVISGQKLTDSEIAGPLRTALSHIGVDTMLAAPDLKAYPRLWQPYRWMAKPKDLDALTNLRIAIDRITTGTFRLYMRVQSTGGFGNVSMARTREVLFQRLDRVYHDLQAYIRDHPFPIRPYSVMRETVKAQVFMTRIYLSTMDKGTQTSFDDHLADFLTITTALRKAIAVQGQDSITCPAHLPPFSLEIGIISALYYAGRLCRDVGVRRDCLRMLKLCPRRDGYWDALDCWKILKLIIKTEADLARELDEEWREGMVIPETCRIWAARHTKFGERKDKITLFWRKTTCSSTFSRRILDMQDAEF